MRIVIFDDDANDRQILVGMIMDWEERHGCKDVIIMQYESIHDLKFSLPEIQFSDIFFLDIMTPESPNVGFLLAERIHLKNPNANIVFTTNSQEYWHNAFEIFALHYLTKPVRSEDIYKLLDYVYLSPSKRSLSAGRFPKIGYEEIIEYDKILYIEAKTSTHTANVHLCDGSKSEISLSHMSFSALEKCVLNDDFAQCHRSIIVNLNFVETYDQHSLRLKNCNWDFPIGRNYRTSFINRIINRQKRLRRL